MVTPFAHRHHHARLNDLDLLALIGRYAVRTMAKRMGTRAGFEPNPDGGSLFFIDLPSPMHRDVGAES